MAADQVPDVQTVARGIEGCLAELVARTAKER